MNYSDLFGLSDDECEVVMYDRAIENTLIAAAGNFLAPPPMHSPLPPDTPCHVPSSQSIHGDYAITQVGTDVPLTLSTQCTDYNWDGQESEFTSYPKDDAVVEHVFEATENQKGLQAIVALKSSRSSFLDYSGIYPEYNPTISKIEACRPTGQNGTYAFLQVTTRGHGFQKHDNALARNTITMTGQSYQTLLRFFDKDWQRVSSKMKSELKSMQEASRGVNICRGLSFYGNGVSRYQKLLESYGDFALFLIISVDSTVAGKADRIFVQVKYKKHPDSPMPDADVRSLGEIDLPVEALVFFAGTREKLRFAMANLQKQDNASCQSKSAETFPAATKEPSTAALKELASQICHPVPQVELKMQNAATKILEYVAGPSSRNELTAEQIAEGKKSTKTPGAVAKAESNKKERSAGTKATKQRPAMSNQPSIQQLVNRGLSDVTGERTGYFTSSAKSNSVSNAKCVVRKDEGKEEKENFRIPKAKRPKV